MERTTTELVRSVLLGRDDRTDRVLTRFALTVPLLLTVAAAYRSGAVETGTGVIFLPGYAAIAGMVVSCWAGYRRYGLVAAWLFTHGALLGYYVARHALGSPWWTLSSHAGFLFDWELWLWVAVAALVHGTPAYAAGSVLRRAIAACRRRVG